MKFASLATLAGSAVASLSVYVHNADAASPASGFGLVHEHVPALAAHFIGSDDEFAEDPVLEAARYIPGTFMDSRNSAVVVLKDFDAAAAEDLLGSPLDTMGNKPSTEDVLGLRAEAARQAIRDLDQRPYAIYLLEVGDDQTGIIEDILAVQSKVMIIGVPSGEQVPALSYYSAPKRSLEPEKSPLVAASLFESESQCVKTTHNCSSHGTCIKGGSGWACACTPTKHHGYTSYWGGSACEKRDVSWQFNLLLWTTVGILVAAGGSVGLLFSIDSEELPGILNVQ